ncbi:MAG: hypothetical protein AABY22_23805, partial [Nanoarchaeota archaeon]
MDMPIYSESIGHFLTGISISLADRLFSENAARHKNSRKERKLEEVAALHYLFEVEENNNPEIKKSKDYKDAIAKAKNHFDSLGVTGSKISYWIKQERINNLSFGQKFSFAYALELMADAGVAVSQIFWGRGNGLIALGESTYQGLSLGLGLYAGKGILYLKDFFFKSKEEKELDEMSTELTSSGRLLDVVKNYSLAQKLESEEPKQIEANEGAISINVNMGTAREKVE